MLEPTEQFADHLHRQLTEGAHHLRGRVAEEGHVVLGEGDLGDDGQVGDGADRLDGQAHFDEIGKGLDDKSVHAAFEQSLGLF